jgi:FtsP/CotA-like multicopper oxidase with cupredoxin domain
LGPQQRHRDRVALAKASIVQGADNPGIWMLHCHNTYHQKAGMTTSLNYSG